MATLYRKYRPQTFDEVVGQNHIKVTLQHEISSGKIAHAYLFAGPRGVSKTTIARVFAKSINCLNRKPEESNPCNECEMCVETTAGRNMDVIEIDAASHTGVDNVRENIIAAARISGRAKYKVFIIDEVHMLSSSAFNALLKVLEEPPRNVIFILCTTEIFKIPATIISRCQRFDFRRISLTDSVKKLQYIIDKEGIKMDKSILEEISRHSEGHMRDAESLLGQIVAIGGKEISREEADLVIPRSDLSEAVRLIDYLSRRDAPNSIGLVNKLVDDGVNLKRFTTDLLELLRKVMLTKVSPDLGEKLGLELGEHMEAEIIKILPGLSLAAILDIIDKFNIAKEELKNSFITQMPLEIAIVRLCQQPAPVAPPPPVSAPTPPTRPSAPLQSAPTAPIAPAPETKPPVLSVSGDIDKNVVLSRWDEVLVKVKKYNHSLIFILKACQPSAVIDGKMNLVFKYKIHRDRMNDQNIKEAVDKVLSEVYGGIIEADAVLDENLNLNIIENGGNEADSRPVASAAEEEISLDDGKNLLNNLLSTFGGKVVSE